MTTRAAILVDERDRRVGRCVVPEATFVIGYRDGLFVRTEEGARLSGGGVGVIFRETDVLMRHKLDPA